MCACGAETRHNVHCYQSRNVSCGRPCNAPLECGLHQCPEPCHRHPDRPELVDGCGRSCGKPLPVCGHPCQQPCHPHVAACPQNVVCSHRITITCECGRQSLKATCGVLDGEPTVEHPTIACDETCAKELRKKQLAQAFGKQHQAWQDSQMMVGLARTHPLLLRRIEQQLCFLISNNAGFEFTDDAIVPNVVFPSMGAAQRKLVHLVAESFGLSSESFGQDRARAVWVTLRPNAHPPTTLLSQVLQEQQQEVEGKGFRASDCGVLLSQMSPSILTKDLQNLLQPWRNQWALHWLDDNSCLVIFDDPGLARVAVNQLKGPFAVTLFREEQHAMTKSLMMDVAKREAANNSNNNNNNVESEQTNVVAETELVAQKPVSPTVSKKPAITLESLRPPGLQTSNAYAALQKEKSPAPRKIMIASVDDWEQRVDGGGGDDDGIKNVDEEKKEPSPTE